MNAKLSTVHYKPIGIYFIAGALIMLAGAICWQLSGVDLDSTLRTGTMPNYLSSIRDVELLVILNLSFWIIGVFLMGTAGVMLSNLSTNNPVTAYVGKMAFITAVPLAIASFIAMFTITMHIAPSNSEEHVLLAKAIGWFASRADWAATVLVVGFGPYFICKGGRDLWAPSWLSVWGGICALAGLLTIVALFTNSLSTYGFLIVPIGLGWMIATGITLLRKSIKPEPVDPYAI